MRGKVFMSKKLGPCPDCGTPIGERHREGCDIERCPHCAWAALGCGTSTRMIRDGKFGMANGRARAIANAWASTATVIQTFLI